MVIPRRGTISTPKGDVLTTGSDVRLKTDFTQASENASERIERLGVCEYRMKGETRRRRGFIAQQAEKLMICILSSASSRRLMAKI